MKEKINIEAIQNCKNCLLHLNQSPRLDNLLKKRSYFWVGISAIFDFEESKSFPLDKRSNTGALIEKIENQTKKIGYKTNLVKCLPLAGTNKIRYPLLQEIEDCYNNLLIEIEFHHPNLVFLLGKQVSDFVLKKQKINYSLISNFKYEKFKINDIIYVPIHHPSFILVYQKKNLDKYTHEIKKIINKNC